MRSTITALLLASGVASTYAADRVVVTRDMKFSVPHLTTTVGTRVLFVNEDPFPHAVFSAAEAFPFDLGTLLKGQPPRAVVFDRPGSFVIECAMHPGMTMTVDVQR